MIEPAMPPQPTATLGVVGAGTMGAGIAQVALEAGWHVRLFDPFPGATDRGIERIRDGLGRRAAKQSMGGTAAATWVVEHLGRLTLPPEIAGLAARTEMIIEAIVEDLGVKRSVFGELDAVAAHSTILATNTSALSVSEIAESAAVHPERVLGLHFFNPAPVLRLVEVVAGGLTDPAILERATSIVESWNKTPVHSADTPGFIVNRVNRPFTIEALRMLEAGEARVGEIDAAMRADGFPMGPFELMDLVGLDVNLAAATAIWDGLGRPEHLRPSPIQDWLVRQGKLGRKTGLGFYRYGQGHDPVLEPLPPFVAPHDCGSHALLAEAIVRRIRSAIAAEAIAARDEGVASEADIDTALWLGAAHPEGPFVWLRHQK